ncbi:MAG TPA: GNAT family N-acetyltransferase [Acetobacteraceae bacterium]|jgi:CelD/BcsL family acetyltransferase involved in cellulose biosynthesis|nr:GNAT family N-acetyltransferase [Acetobacteraceae bacterium]
MLRATLSRPRLDAGGLAALEPRWRTFAKAARASFFQDWTWVGCLAAERFPDPVLLELFEGESLAGLALFNRRASLLRGDALYLHESDDPVLDSIFIEHNGPLVAKAGPEREALLVHMLREAMHGVLGGTKRPRRLMLSGVGPECAAAAAGTGGYVAENSARVAPYVDFSAVPEDQPFIERLSRNTRHQLRRSNRLYEVHGKLTLSRADTVETALDYLNKLIMLHDITWKARGKAGAFATAAVRRFHHALIARGVPGGEVDLLRITAGPVLVGYLMNFNHNGQVSAYQSGFNYSAAGPHQKPGLTCHYLAIEAYRAAGAAVYDFLAGADRYKLSLANAQRWLHWLSVAPQWHPEAVAMRLRAAVGI